MYLSQNQLVSEVQCISRVRVTVAGKPATDHDVRQFLSVTLCRYGLEADLSGQSSIAQSVYRRCIHSVQEVDLQKYAQDHKYLKLRYLRAIQSSSRGWIPWSDFKRQTAGHVHYKWIMTMVARYYEQPKLCLQWLCFDERLLLDTNDDISDEIEAYVSFERELQGYRYPEDVCIALRSIIRDWLCDFSLGESAPDPIFGPGAVADGRGRMPHLEKAVMCVYDLPTVKELCEFWDCAEDDLIVGRAGEASFQNRIVFRPKNALAHRIISSEPCWLSWLQQAIKRPLYDYVEQHPKMFTWFSDQEESRVLALRGSIDGSYATFDFSSASDAITVPLVSMLFSETYIHDALFLTRSREALMPDGQTVSLTKFAPMGSATCFVTMDIIILSICEQAIRTALGRPGRRGDYVVYGDDAIIRVEAASTFAKLSQALHMRVNEDKSYWDANTVNFYRESCGIEAYNGCDITPLRYSRFQEPIVEYGPPSEGYLESCITLMNRAYVDYGFANLRSVVQEVIKLSGRSKKSAQQRARFFAIWDRALRIDYSDFREGFDGPLAVVVPDGTATNYHCRRRYNADLQRSEVQVSQVKRHRRDPHDMDAEETLLHLWYFRAATVRPDPYDLEKSGIVDSAGGLVSQKWGTGWFGR